MRDPYEILVSEIMLQQTPVSRVLEKLPPFLNRFPSLEHLAGASAADVIRAWKGIGYNLRAIRLRALAVTIKQLYGGAIPRDLKQLQELPGIGQYTAHAMMSFAFEQKVPVVDVNIMRLLSRVFWKLRRPYEVKSPRTVWRLAGRILPEDSQAWNQALMDIGATVCKVRHPSCERCPIQKLCLSRVKMAQATMERVKLSRKTEPMYDGVAQRIWRGKIVEILRAVPEERSVKFKDIGAAIKRSFSRQDVPWLICVVNALVADGVVAKSGRDVNMRVRLGS